jgi:hypothetical protein
LFWCGCRDVGYRGFWFFPWLESKSQQERQAVVAKTLKLMADGTMSPPVGEYWAAAALCMQHVLCNSYHNLTNCLVFKKYVCMYACASVV